MKLRPPTVLEHITAQEGLTENDGHENDGPSKLQGMKLQDMKMQDMKMQDMKMQDTMSFSNEDTYILTVYVFSILNDKQ